MAAPPDITFLSELFSAFGPVSVRRMFGGAGIYAEGVMFALGHDGVVYLKSDDASAAAFDQEGAGPFSYTAKGGRHTIASFRRLPERLYDDPDELAAWARQAVDAARRAATAKPNTAKRKPGTRPTPNRRR